MYVSNEEWEQNNQDYLKESYEETGFTTGGYAIRKLICGGCGRVFYTTIYTKKYCHSYWCGNQANNRRQREYRQMRRQDLVCQCCGEKFTPKRAGARYCSNACRQKDYRKRVTDAASAQNEHLVKRNAKIRHTERNRSIPDLLSSRKTCPEETIYQLGTLDEHASAGDLLNIVTEFIEEFKAKFGEHVHVLDWALHLDESTPHIHERHVFDCENKYGEIAPQQEKALEALGFELPNPGKPLSRRNNRKITFDAACRKMLFEIAKRHGLDLEEEAEYGNRKYLEKQDFILAKQKERLVAQQNRLDELTLKVSDMETLLEDVSAAAYDKAVEVVTDVVRTETRKEDMRMIEDTKRWVLSPERKAPRPHGSTRPSIWTVF